MTVEGGLPAVDRVSGVDRYASAVEASKAGWSQGAETVYVVSGEVFPDALSATPAAASDDAPILLVQRGGIPESVQAELDRLSPASIIIVGGTDSVSPEVESALSEQAEVSRIAGDNRYETSREIAAAAFPEGSSVAVVAAGANFADALSAGAAVGSDGPVVLVDGTQTGLDEATTALLTELGSDAIDVVGGNLSVSDGILADAKQIATAERLGGIDRYDSSRMINAAFFDTADRVLLATGVTFPDALAGSALAARVDAPLFTVPGTCVPAKTLEQIAQLGATHVTLLGGELTLTPAVGELTACAG
ncbi:MAG: cell wall-binding repeat-containing protein [Herbiconiux sp.]|nr:cell wall-binding repeat-containing protein [Herbiconiux sp.]